MLETVRSKSFLRSSCGVCGVLIAALERSASGVVFVLALGVHKGFSRLFFWLVVLSCCHSSCHGHGVMYQKDSKLMKKEL